MEKAEDHPVQMSLWKFESDPVWRWSSRSGSSSRSLSSSSSRGSVAGCATVLTITLTDAGLPDVNLVNGCAAAEQALAL